MATSSSRRVGLEVSNSAVRIAEVSVSGGRAKLLNLGQVRLPARSVVDGAIADVSAVSGAIERCVKEGGFSIKEVHLGVAGLRAITRELEMPNVPDSELDSAVRLQALDVIPFAADKTLMSARPLEDVVDALGVPQRRVLLAAAHRDLVDSLLEAVDAAGLVPATVDLSSTALVRALYDPSVPAVGPEAIVSIGSGLTTIIVHEGGTPHFVRTIAEGGDTITAAIAGTLDLPIDDAESTKRNLDQAGPQYRAADAAAQEAATTLISEIRSSVEYYSTLPGRSEVRRVMLTGGGSRLAGFTERLQQQLRAEVVLGSALARVDASALNLRPDDAVRRDALVSAVIGLALPDPPGVKPLDLLPPEITAERKAKRTERLVFAAAAVVLVALAGLGVYKYFQVHNAQSNLATAEQQQASLKTQIAKNDIAARAYTAIEDDSKSITGEIAGEAYWPYVTADLASTVPVGGTITSLSATYTPPIVATAAPSKTAPSTTTAATSTAQLEQEQIGSISVTVSTTGGLDYFKTFYGAMLNSTKFSLVSLSPIETSSGVSTWSAVLGVRGTIQTPRTKNFEVGAK